MHYLKKLKNILRYNLFTILIVCFSLLYVLYSCQKNIVIHNDDYIDFIGIVEVIKYGDNKIQLQVKNTSRILANYYFSDDIALESIKDIKIGNKIKVSGKVKIPSENTNFNIFNYRKYLLSKQIKYTVDIDDLKIVDYKQNLFYGVKTAIGKHLLKSRQSAYLKAFILGDTSYLDEEIKQSYLTNGISHLFSVSGMHVGFLSSIILIILNKLCKNKNLNQLLLFLFLIFYAFLAGFSPSIMRSVIFMIVLFIKEKMALPYSTFKLFILMSCFFLLYNPYYIYNTGFIYSFIISGFLIYFSNILKNKNYFNKLFFVSSIAFLASFPISLFNNFELNFLSPLLNLIFVPLVSFVIFPLSFVILFFPSLTIIYEFFITILETISLWCTSNFSLIMIFGKPSIFVVIFYYLLVVFILKNMKKKLGYILLFMLFLVHFNSRLLFSSSKITMIDVGQGDSLLIEFQHNKGIILVDTGGVVGSSYSLGKSTIIPYLKSLGIKKINYLVFTHGDYDHMGEAINLVENFKVENVIFNCGEFNDLEQDLIKVLDKKRIPYYSCISELNIGKNKMYFLNTKDYNDENENSSVIYTEINGSKMLFMGDAGIEREKDILDKYSLTDIDFLKVGHHGSNTSSSKEFIENINPKNCLISVGKNNRYGHPKESVIDSLDDYCTIYRTDINGSVEIKLNKNNYKIRTIN